MVVSPEKFKSYKKRVIGSLKDKFSVDFTKNYKMDISEFILSMNFLLDTQHLLWLFIEPEKILKD